MTTRRLVPNNEQWLYWLMAKMRMPEEEASWWATYFASRDWGKLSPEEMEGLAEALVPPKRLRQAGREAISEERRRAFISERQGLGPIEERRAWEQLQAERAAMLAVPSASDRFDVINWGPYSPAQINRIIQRRMKEMPGARGVGEQFVRGTQVSPNFQSWLQSRLPELEREFETRFPGGRERWWREVVRPPESPAETEGRARWRPLIGGPQTEVEARAGPDPWQTFLAGRNFFEEFKALPPRERGFFAGRLRPRTRTLR